MATSSTGKVCDVDGASCKRIIQARCYHCDKDLCRVHLLEHVQLVEEKTRNELNSLVDQFNQVSARFASMSISPRILEEPFARLEQWREEAHRQIDRITEAKRTELTGTIRRYRQAFATSNEQQVKKLDAKKEQLATHVAETEATRQQIEDLQSSVDGAMSYLASLDKHRINIAATVPNYTIDIRTESGNGRVELDDDLRRFQITYVRLDGSIRSYLVLTNKSGNIMDLKNSFVEEYSVLIESNEMMQGTNDDLIHRPQADYILATQIYNHRVRLQYQDRHSLKEITIRDKITFYETPYSLVQENNSRILMPCSFQHSTSKEPVGLPIYLDVPRHNCKGQDVRDAISDALDRFLQMDSKDAYLSLDVTVTYQVKSMLTSQKLYEVLSDQMDFVTTNISIMIVVSTQMVEAYQNTGRSSTQASCNVLNWNQ